MATYNPPGSCVQIVALRLNEDQAANCGNEWAKEQLRRLDQLDDPDDSEDYADEVDEVEEENE
jgi:hypothetical protein